MIHLPFLSTVTIITPQDAFFNKKQNFFTYYKKRFTGSFFHCFESLVVAAPTKKVDDFSSTLYSQLYFFSA